jgi:hypothetical protein
MEAWTAKEHLMAPSWKRWITALFSLRHTMPNLRRSMRRSAGQESPRVVVRRRICRMSSDERCVTLVRYQIRATVPATDSTVASEPLDFSLGPFALRATWKTGY